MQELLNPLCTHEVLDASSLAVAHHVLVLRERLATLLTLPLPLVVAPRALVCS